METHFVHADEAETACGLLMFKDMIDMSAVKDAWGEPLLPDGWIDKSCDTLRRGATWRRAKDIIRLNGKPRPARDWHAIHCHGPERKASDCGDPQVSYDSLRRDTRGLSCRYGSSDGKGDHAQGRGDSALPEGAGKRRVASRLIR